MKTCPCCRHLRSGWKCWANSWWSKTTPEPTGVCFYMEGSHGLVFQMLWRGTPDEHMHTFPSTGIKWWPGFWGHSYRCQIRCSEYRVDTTEGYFRRRGTPWREDCVRDLPGTKVSRRFLEWGNWREVQRVPSWSSCIWENWRAEWP